MTQKSGKRRKPAKRGPKEQRLVISEAPEIALAKLLRTRKPSKP